MTETIISSIISAVLGAIIAAVTTLVIERRRENKRLQEKAEIERKEIFENRPEYKVIDFKDYISRTGYGIKQICDLDVFLTSIIGIKNNGRIDV